MNRLVLLVVLIALMSATGGTATAAQSENPTPKETTTGFLFEREDRVDDRHTVGTLVFAEIHDDRIALHDLVSGTRYPPICHGVLGGILYAHTGDLGWMTIDLATGKSRRFEAPAPGFLLQRDWPRRYYMHRSSETPATVRELDFAAEAYREALVIPEFKYSGYIRMAPDGTQVAYMEPGNPPIVAEGGAYRLVCVDLETGASRRPCPFEWFYSPYSGGAQQDEPEQYWIDEDRLLVRCGHPESWKPAKKPGSVHGLIAPWLAWLGWTQGSVGVHENPYNYIALVNATTGEVQSLPRLPGRDGVFGMPASIDLWISQDDGKPYVRISQEGEPHDGRYLVDVEKGSYVKDNDDSFPGGTTVIGPFRSVRVEEEKRHTCFLYCDDALLDTDACSRTLRASPDHTRAVWVAGSRAPYATSPVELRYFDTREGIVRPVCQGRFGHRVYWLSHEQLSPTPGRPPVPPGWTPFRFTSETGIVPPD